MRQSSHIAVAYAAPDFVLHHHGLQNHSEIMCGHQRSDGFKRRKDVLKNVVKFMGEKYEFHGVIYVE